MWMILPLLLLTCGLIMFIGIEDMSPGLSSSGRFTADNGHAGGIHIVVIGVHCSL